MALGEDRNEERAGSRAVSRGASIWLGCCVGLAALMPVSVAEGDAGPSANCLVHVAEGSADTPAATPAPAPVQPSTPNAAPTATLNLLADMPSVIDPTNLYSETTDTKLSPA